MSRDDSTDRGPAGQARAEVVLYMRRKPAGFKFCAVAGMGEASHPTGGSIGGGHRSARPIGATEHPPIPA